MKYEGSKADKIRDRKQARKHKESLRAWEHSDLDKKMDAAGQKKLDMKAKKNGKR